MKRLMVSMWPMLSLFAIVAIATSIMLAVRFYLVEPTALAQACVADNSGWRCQVREFAVFGFLHNSFGITALIAGVLATVARWRVLALLAILAGIAAASLYTFELGGVGLLLGALVWVHRAPAQDASEQQAQAAEG